MDERSISRRTTRACQRCRRRKIKCSGSQPCTHCSQKNLECQFIADRRVVVKESYLRQLRRAADGKATHTPDAALLSNSPEVAPPPLLESNPIQISNDHPSVQTSSPPPSSTSLDPANNCRNPLTADTSSYVDDGAGRLRCLGESSTWSFSRKTLLMIRNHIPASNLPDIEINAESHAYNLSWGSPKFNEPVNYGNFPSIDYAIFLLNGVKFHVGQLFHLYDEDEFMRHFYELYDNPSEKTESNRIWYTQFLALLALGKAVAVTSGQGSTTIPGAPLFIRAMNLLPDPSYLFNDALTSIEALCIISLYLQTADMRNAAYIYIGQAVRMALVFGLHRERPNQDWDPKTVDRCHRIWWTVYILDRTFASSMGVPMAIQDSDITTSMPNRPNCRKSTALRIHVKLSGVVAHIVNKVYGAEGRKSFLSCVREVLEQIASIAAELNTSFPLSLNICGDDISRVSAHLHLFYHQSILVTLYPVLLHLFEARIQQGGKESKLRGILSDTTQALIQRCSESCSCMIRILGVLRQAHLLESSFPFDLERVFSSSFVTIMLSFIFSNTKDYESLREESLRILDDLIGKGSIPARFRKSELNSLENLIRLWESQKGNEEQGERHDIHTSCDEPTSQPICPERQSHELTTDVVYSENIQTAEWDDLTRLSPNEILSLAEMVGMHHSKANEDVDWVTSWLWKDNDPISLT